MDSRYGGKQPSEPGSLPDGMTSEVHVFLQPSDESLDDRFYATNPVTTVQGRHNGQLALRHSAVRVALAPLRSARSSRTASLSTRGTM